MNIPLRKPPVINRVHKLESLVKFIPMQFVSDLPEEHYLPHLWCLIKILDVTQMNLLMKITQASIVKF